MSILWRDQDREHLRLKDFVSSHLRRFQGNLVTVTLQCRTFTLTVFFSCIVILGCALCRFSIERWSNRVCACNAARLAISYLPIEVDHDMFIGDNHGIFFLPSSATCVWIVGFEVHLARCHSKRSTIYTRAVINRHRI